MKTLLASVCLATLGATAQASTLNLTFTGQGVGTNAGTQAIVAVSIDTTTAEFPAFGGIFYNGAYEGTVSVTGGDYDGSTGTFSSSLNRLFVDDNRPSVGDVIIFEQFFSATNFNTAFQLNLTDSGGTAFNSEQIPAIWDLSAYDTALFTFTAPNILGTPLVGTNRDPLYNITSIEVGSANPPAVPLPASITMSVFAIGALRLVAHRRKQAA